MSVLRTPITETEQCLPPMQRLADARRILEINCDGNPFIDAEGRREIRLAKRAAWQILADVTEQLVATLDTAAGDPDLEEATNLEDEGVTPWTREACDGPGCVTSDHGEEEPDREDDDPDSEHDGCEEERGQ